MRNLTIKRNKSFVGSLGKMKVYIEDATANELSIDGVPCRKLGDLKNGEEKTFSIDENAAKVFVIADTLSKNICNEFYNIPEGAEDIALNGQCRYNPASGNPFRFDGVTDEEVLKNRKKSSKKSIVVLIIAVIVGVIIGLAATGIFSSPSAKTFTAENLKITLTDEFKSTPMDGFDAVYESKYVLVCLQEDKFYWVEGMEDYTLEQYGELFLEFNEMDPSVKIQSKEGLVCFDYQEDVDGSTYQYFAVIYKASDAFWTVQFATPVENYKDLQSDFIKWAKTVTFTE